MKNKFKIDFTQCRRCFYITTHIGRITKDKYGHPHCEVCEYVALKQREEQERRLESFFDQGEGQQ
jgi:hypothetical protein